jgi:hypothetical protein
MSTYRYTVSTVLFVYGWLYPRSEFREQQYSYEYRTDH